MKLYGSPASPFVRKVLACAITREIDGRIELVEVNANASPAALLAVTPLSKVPALVTEDDASLYDSPVVCEYLDSLGDAPALFPPSGRARWLALKQQALGDGIADAAVLRRGEGGRPREAARDAVLARQKAAIDRSLAELDREPPHGVCDIGTLAIACALGYLDFRFAHEPWRDTHRALAAWFTAISAEPGLARSLPRELG